MYRSRMSLRVIKSVRLLELVGKHQVMCNSPNRLRRRSACFLPALRGWSTATFVLLFRALNIIGKSLFRFQLRVEAGHRSPSLPQQFKVDCLRSSTEGQCQQDCCLCKPTGPNPYNVLRAYPNIRLCH
ncbi:hypothetical protein BJY00DRAFT_198727 [Aspergillus carlsbadensis]|nr:hypothetical protein BJY00DRAFT_198727 [Aspergillus carlsbadensis]